ncbi:MAG: glycosyltransferase, partial [Solirubrobacterales bacterium]
GPAIAGHLAADGLPAEPLTATGLTFAAADGGRRHHCEENGAFGDPRPFASVVVCTRNRPESLTRTIASVLELDYPSFELVIVDNSPEEAGTLAAVSAVGDPRVRYVAEPRPGLSCARNRGLSVAEGELIAFTDDDVVVDRLWLASLARAFTRSPLIGCVTGLVPTAELRTAEQSLFDRIVSWSSSMRPRIVDPREHPADDPLFPYRTGRLGTGANFALSRAAARDVGPFDEALGAGAPAGGGEDLDYFLRALDHQWSIAVEPAAIAWHYHRADRTALQRQLYTYGSGAMAYGIKHALVPRHAARLTRLLVSQFAQGNRRPFGGVIGGAVEPSLGESLTRARRRGRIAGPYLYAKGRLRNRGHTPWRIS